MMQKNDALHSPLCNIRILKEYMGYILLKAILNYMKYYYFHLEKFIKLKREGLRAPHFVFYGTTV